jgi:hypothetical protein
MVTFLEKVFDNNAIKLYFFRKTRKQEGLSRYSQVFNVQVIEMTTVEA